MDKQFVLRHNLSDAKRLGGAEAAQEYNKIYDQLTQRERAIKAVNTLVYLDSYIGGIPDRIVHSVDGNYKCRRGWFCAIFWNFEDFSDTNIIDQELFEIVREVDKLLTPKLIKNLTTLEDIALGDDLIRLGIENLKERYQIRQEEL